MAQFVHDTEMNLLLEDIIREAEDLLVFFCPYFKLHARLRDCLKLRQQDEKLRIIVVFGKNEDDPSKSLSKEDMEFLKVFPYVDIAYEKRLHAKYYASEKVGIITSLNLYTHSLNNNIEAGVLFQSKNLFKSLTEKTLGNLTSFIADTEDLASQANGFFIDIFKNAEKIFQKEPKFESSFLGLQKKYIGSDILIDRSDWFYNHALQYGNDKRSSIGFNISNQQKAQAVIERGFCIRTKEKIFFNPSRPLSRSAYNVWAEFGNQDFRERYCHSCGKSWSSSVRNPLCNQCQ